jgi:hypothetical protein
MKGTSIAAASSPRRPEVGFFLENSGYILAEGNAFLGGGQGDTPVQARAYADSKGSLKGCSGLVPFSAQVCR